METVEIYTLEHPITNEIRYIGKSKNKQIRFSNHLCEKGNTHKVNWITSLKKQGLKPVIKELDTVPTVEWQFWEMYYISLFKSWGFKLVNGTDGGDGNNGIVDIGIISVNCFNLDGSLFKQFKSIKEASKYFNTRSSHITDCCRGKLRSFKNKIWRYENDAFDKFEVVHKKRKIIIKCDLNGNSLEEYESIIQAAKSNNYQETSISRCLRGLRSKYKGFKWKYK